MTTSPTGRAATIGEQIAKQEAKLKRIDEQLGRAMTRRADEEEKLARLYRQRNLSNGAAAELDQ